MPLELPPQIKELFRSIESIDQELSDSETPCCFGLRRKSLHNRRNELISQLRGEVEVRKQRLEKLDQIIASRGLVSTFFGWVGSEDAERARLVEELLLISSHGQDMESFGCTSVAQNTPLWNKVVATISSHVTSKHRRHYKFRIEVKKIWMIPMNGTLKSYEEQAQKIGEATPLFHGTSVSNAANIIKNGFQLPRQHKHGGMFGKGIYFAECPLKSVHYTKPPGCYSRICSWFNNTPNSGHRQMLLCDVYLGRSKSVWFTARPKLNPAVDLKADWLTSMLGYDDFQSVVAGESMFSPVKVTEYIIYNPCQAIPKYLIEFERRHDRLLRG